VERVRCRAYLHAHTYADANPHGDIHADPHRHAHSNTDT
jgi:hypothetical protein